MASNQARGWAGISRLRKLLRKLPDEMTAEVKTAISDWAEAIKLDAQDAAPKDSGDMAADCGVSISRDGFAASVGYSRKLFPRQWNRSGWRAKFVEHGTKGYMAGSTRRSANFVKKMKRNIPARPARPFLFPAYEKNREWGHARMRQAIDEALRRASTIGDEGSDE